MLIKTLQEVKEVLPKLVASLNDESLLPNFDAIEEKYLVPLIGNDLYSDLQAHYDDAILAEKETILLRHVRLLIASYGFLEELAANHVVLTDFGVRTHDTDAMPKAVGWEYKEIKAHLQDRALDGAEVLLGYLWKNKVDFPRWTASDAYTQFESLLIRTGSEFSPLYTLYQPMRTFYILKPYLEDVQLEYLVDGFGADLIEYFLTIDAPTGEEKAVLKLLKKGLAFLTVKRAGEHQNVRFSEAGFSVLSLMFGGDKDTPETGRNAATPQQLTQKLKACERDGKNFLSRAKNEAVKLRTLEGVPPAYAVAFDKGPLVSYINPRDRDNGNGRRKIFVL